MKGALAIRYIVPMYASDEQIHKVLHNVEVVKEYCMHFDINFVEIPGPDTNEYLLMMYEGKKLPRSPKKFVIFDGYDAKSKKYDDMLQIVGNFFQYYD